MIGGEILMEARRVSISSSLGRPEKVSEGILPKMAFRLRIYNKLAQN